jgi:hypothetical protein
MHVRCATRGKWQILTKSDENGRRRQNVCDCTGPRGCTEGRKIRRRARIAAQYRKDVSRARGVQKQCRAGEQIAKNKKVREKGKSWAATARTTKLEDKLFTQ